MKLTGYRSPGRKAMSRLCSRATVERFTMRNAPAAVEEDRECYQLFQEWKRAGTPREGELFQRLCRRFNEVTRAPREEVAEVRGGTPSIYRTVGSGLVSYTVESGDKDAR